jgi:hypothetical protein
VTRGQFGQQVLNGSSRILINCRWIQSKNLAPPCSPDKSNVKSSKRSTPALREVCCAATVVAVLATIAIVAMVAVLVSISVVVVVIAEVVAVAFVR